MGLDNISDSIEGNGKVIVVTSLVMVLFFILISTIVFFMSVKTADQVLVPNIEGEKFEDAVLKLQVKELYPRLQLRFSDNPEDAGKVLEQSPPAGTIVKAGKRINIVVSSGAVLDRVENYVGKTISDVQQHFASLFTAGRKQLISIKEPIMYKASSIPAGTILEQNPSPDTEISEEILIEFIVSKGPENEKVSVPNMEGFKLNDIYSAISQNKISFTIKAEINSALETPLVVSQSEPADSSVDAYSQIELGLQFPESTEKMIYGLYSPILPKYPYPVKVTVDAVYPDGKRAELISFNHQGGKCDIPYGLPQGTVLVLTVLNKQVQMFEVKQ
ncbi:PASTA domain-containing protein [Treponema putidum]|uniref:PASTA domain-containing protein n=1 Tax=Treponema putidum TaxID=221027 RepID=A0AAE9MTJ1_9SPIR|nr:PASTA domain-containing protein [Treponema putidum]AIN94643.1 penicillin-binding protein [Treponema putidum]TWI78752.1 beta-lactam-binding protein with PASTA domain [Treponema putidum]UTY28666.1 PASTA domain-containing protein [Treponema putidum]UTY31100.1 PASTA domain-containing protein [Treponema putidum]UTY33531.1 PASTA domain-containing protein [Treponema putidum]